MTAMTLVAWVWVSLVSPEMPEPLGEATCGLDMRVNHQLALVQEDFHQGMTLYRIVGGPEPEPGRTACGLGQTFLARPEVIAEESARAAQAKVSLRTLREKLRRVLSQD